MFRIFFLIMALTVAFAKDWAHYSGHSDVRDVALAGDGTLWEVFAWGVQERIPKGHIISYVPGNDGLESSDFVQVFALPNGNVIVASKDGTLSQKKKNSNKFETINFSFIEKKRNLEHGLGKLKDNILILPFNGALTFFDYSINRSVITILQIGSSSLDEHRIERVAVKDNNIWVKLGSFIWTRQINWKEIHKDNFLADPTTWALADKIPFDEEPKPSPSVHYSSLYFPMERVKTISLISGESVLLWGNSCEQFSRIKSKQDVSHFEANPSDYGNDQNSYLTKSLVMHPNGSFAVGMWGSGIITFGANNQKIEWFHSTNPSGSCLTGYRDGEDYTITQGLALVPDFSGYVFSYISQNNYGFGFLDNNSNSLQCVKTSEASSSAAYSVIVLENNIGEWEIYVAWRSNMSSKDGGVDFYKTNPKNFSPILQKKWALPFGSPIDFAVDSKGILWAVSISKIFYLDKKNSEWEWKEPDYIRGFSSSAISSLETDARNGLWIGTIGDGAYFLSQTNNSPDSLTAKQFKVKEGLLNEIVYDIAIDTIKGNVYFGHEFGFSVYSTALVRSGAGYMQSGAPKTIVYPNPFRPSLHNTLTIDYISEKSSVYILDSFGKRVRFFSGSDLKGGAVRWDGTNESGRLVAPGLYHYIAADGKKTVKGKILVER